MANIKNNDNTSKRWLKMPNGRIAYKLLVGTSNGTAVLKYSSAVSYKIDHATSI